MPWKYAKGTKNLIHWRAARPPRWVAVTRSETPMKGEEADTKEIDKQGDVTDLTPQKVMLKGDFTNVRRGVLTRLTNAKNPLSVESPENDGL